MGFRREALDPNYALAHVGVADCYILLGEYGFLRPKEAFPEAERALARAVALDFSLAEAHRSLAMVKLEYHWDWPGAAKEFELAIELNPNDATTHQWYAEYLLTQGFRDKALAAIRHAQELDPDSLIINSYLARAFYHARRPDDAIEQYHKTLAMDANFPYALYYLGLGYAQKGMYREAIAEFRKARQHSQRQTVILGLLGYAQAKSGQEVQAYKLLAELQELAKGSYVSSYSIALIYMGLGDKAQAFTRLRQAVAERDPWLNFVKVEPLLDELRSDMRFADLLKEMGLPP